MNSNQTYGFIMIIRSVQHRALDFPCLRYNLIDDLYVIKHRVIRNYFRGFNNLSYTIHLRQEYMYFLFNRTTIQVFVTYLTGALYVHP